MDAPLRVALDVTPLAGEPTGIARAVDGVLHALWTDQSLAISGWMLSGRRRARPDGVPAGMSVHHCPVPARLLHPGWARLSLPRGRLVHGPADVVHGMNYVVPPSSVPTVLTIQDADLFENPEWYDPNVQRFATLIRRAIDRGCWVHVSTRAVADALSRYCPVPEERLAVIGYGVPDIPPGDAELGKQTAGTSKYVLALGSVNRRKGIPELVEAFDRMPHRPPDLRLVIAGSPGLDEERLERTVAGLADPSAIVRISSIDEAQRSNLLYGASVLAYPSFDEGFGFPPLEAMTAGVPVVASTGGSIPEVVGDAAILTPPGDVEALAGALADALEEPLRTDLAERGRRRLAAHSWEATAAGLADLYRRAAGRS